MIIRPQGIVMALKLPLGSLRLTCAELALNLRRSPPEVHSAVRRLVEARLLDPEARTVRREARRGPLVYGVP